MDRSFQLVLMRKGGLLMRRIWFYGWIIFLSVVFSGANELNELLAKELRVATQAGVSWRLPWRWNLRQGWERGSNFELRLGLAEAWWWPEEMLSELSFWFEPQRLNLAPWGVGLGLVYQEKPEVESVERILLAVSLAAQFSWQGFQFSARDFLETHLIGDYAPLRQVEKNELELICQRFLGQNLNLEALYGLTSWQPLADKTGKAITALGQLRLGWHTEIGPTALSFGYQSLSRRFASDLETWRWLSWLGVYCQLHWPSRLLIDIGYNYGQFAEAYWWLVKKENQHQVELKIILGGGRER